MVNLSKFFLLSIRISRLPKGLAVSRDLEITLHLAFYSERANILAFRVVNDEKLRGTYGIC